MNQHEFERLLTAAEAGNVNAMLCTAQIYMANKGIENHLEKAFKWYEKAASIDALAMYNLGVFYDRGMGVTQNNALAFECYQKAADLGNVHAMFNLSGCYNTGTGVTKSHIQAFKWSQKAADLGHAAAMYNLGICYIEGTGVTKNNEQAFEWFKKSANLGEVQAMFNLGVCYQIGSGTNKSNALTKVWFVKSVEAGYIRVRPLHWLIDNSKGAEKHKWLDLYFDRAAPIFKRFNELCVQVGGNQPSIDMSQKRFKAFLTSIYEIEKEHLYKVKNNSNKGLTHYTSSFIALNVILKESTDGSQSIGNNRLRMGMAAYLNDPTEGKYAFEAVQHNADVDVELIQKRFEDFYNDDAPVTTCDLPEQMFSLSFSKNPDNLNLWRAYGNTDGKANGVGLFIPDETLNSFVADGLKSMQTSDDTAADDFLLFEVKYGKAEVVNMWEKINPSLTLLFKAIKTLAPNDVIRAQMDECLVLSLSRLIYLYKHDAYAAEEEVRAIMLRPLNTAQMDERTPRRLYCETPPLLFLDKGGSIILGPQTEYKTERLWETRKRLAILGLDSKVSVTVSTVPFR